MFQEEQELHIVIAICQEVVLKETEENLFPSCKSQSESRMLSTLDERTI